jgi:hypothetical protein
MSSLCEFVFFLKKRVTTPILDYLSNLNEKFRRYNSSVTGEEKLEDSDLIQKFRYSLDT